MSAVMMYSRMGVQDTSLDARKPPVQKKLKKKKKRKQSNCRTHSATNGVIENTLKSAAVSGKCSSQNTDSTDDDTQAQGLAAVCSAAESPLPCDTQLLENGGTRECHVDSTLTNGAATHPTATIESSPSESRDSQELLACNYETFSDSHCKEVKGLVESDSVSFCSEPDLTNQNSDPNLPTRSLKRKLKRTPSDKTEERSVKKNTTGNVVSLKKFVFVVDKTVKEMKSGPRSDVLNGKEEAKQLFQWLIHPVKSDQFFKELWEKKPLLIKRHNPTYNDGWFSSKAFSDILKSNPIQFGTHLDLTSYRDGKRETHNRPGRAFPDLVWKHYNEGGSIRMLNPQTYSEPVWRLLSTLQDFFRSTMGANVYLTPPGTQGFAPHYDDIEAFLIQLEGKKHWRLYAPRTEEETLPIHSSQNFNQNELGKLILDTVLEAGDMLYFPRGTVHQGNCLPDTHSLHITVSTYQMNTWGDLIEKLLPKALHIARSEDLEYREGLPLDYLDYSGVSQSDVDIPARPIFLKKVEKLMTRLVKYAPVDSAVDELASRLLHDALPPNYTRSSVLTSSAKEEDSPNTAVSRQISECCEGETELTPTVTANSKVRLVTPYVARLLAHEDCVSLQHSASNSRLFHEIDPQEIDYPADYGPALEMLTNSYPTFLEVRSLPLSTATAVQLVQELLDLNILQHKPGSSSKSNSLMAAIKSRVNRPAPKIKSSRYGGSHDELSVKLRENSGSRKSKSLKKPRPSSEIFDKSNTGESPFMFRRNKTLER